jgi:hypothetical protein
LPVILFENFGHFKPTVLTNGIPYQVFGEAYYVVTDGLLSVHGLAPRAHCRLRHAIDGDRARCLSGA